MNETIIPPVVSPAPVFARIAAGSLWTLLAFTGAIALLFGIEAKSINTSGGWGWLMAAALIMALATLACAVCAVASAVSLIRREPHRARSIAFLIVCCLIVWAGKGIAFRFAGGLHEVYQQATAESAARAKRGSPAVPVSPPTGTAVPMTTLDAALLEHFSQRGIALKPATGADARPAEWEIGNVDAGPGCTVSTKFLRFPDGTSAADMQKHLTRFNAATVRNEHAMLAMFYPSARHNVRDGNNCDAWGAKSGPITALLVDAFKAYQQPAVALQPVERR
ncbi:MAG: hypothetical protein ABIS45_07785 [Burkholderiales bacterium]